MADEIRGDRIYTGDVVFGGTVSFPENTIEDEDVALGANIAAQKLQHRHALHHVQNVGADVASVTQVLHVARADVEVVSVEVRPSTVPAGGDKQYTVDVQKAVDGSNTWTSILSSVVTISSADTEHTVQTAVLDGVPALEDGDALRIVVTASGSTGSQGQGLNVTINVDEDAS